MRGIACDKRTAIAKGVRDQAAAIPILFRDDLVVELGADAEDCAQAAIAVDRFEIVLVGPQVIVDQPAFVSVDRIDHAGAARIDGAGAPGAFMLLATDQAGRADEGGLHALNDRVAGEFGADRLADDGARAVATDQEAAIDPAKLAAVEIAHRDISAGVLNDDILDRAAVDDGDTRLRGRVLKQNRLEENLVDTMRRLRRRPVRVGRINSSEAIPAAGNPDTGQLPAGERSAIADVVRIVGGQTCIADLLRDAEPAKDLHRARGNVVAFWLRRHRARTRSHDGHADAAPGKVDGEREPDRPRPDDQHTAFIHSASAPDFLTMSAQRSTSDLM